MEGMTKQKSSETPMFTVLTPENTATVTLNNPINGHSETVTTLNTPSAITYAIIAFGIRQRIPYKLVEYSVIYPTEKAN